MSLLQKSKIMNIHIIIFLLCSSIATTSKASGEELIVNAVGDVMLAGRWSSDLKRIGYEALFVNVKGEFKKADFTIANLESPLATSGIEFTEKKFRFRGNPEIALALKKSGINLVNLANNHIMDYGSDALAETLHNLESAGITSIGAGKNLGEARKMAFYKIKGKKIAFLGYSLTEPTAFFAGKNRSGTAPGFKKLYMDDIKKARSQADYVIVSFHWGTEGKSEIQSYQSETAHNAIDAGADVIIGHHPHVLRGIEKYKRGLILYSLGNFVFASKSKIADASVIVRLHLDDNNHEIEILPVDILYSRVRFQPKMMTGLKGTSIIERLNILSKPFSTQIESYNGRYRIVF